MWFPVYKSQQFDPLFYVYCFVFVSFNVYPCWYFMWVWDIDTTKTWISKLKQVWKRAIIVEKEKGKKQKQKKNTHTHTKRKEKNRNEPQHQKMYLWICAPSEDSDQPVHTRIHFEYPRVRSFFVWTTVILIKLRGCAGSFESTLGVFSRCGSYIRHNV